MKASLVLSCATTSDNMLNTSHLIKGASVNKEEKAYSILQDWEPIQCFFFNSTARYVINFIQFLAYLSKLWTAP